MLGRPHKVLRYINISNTYQKKIYKYLKAFVHLLCAKWRKWIVEVVDIHFQTNSPSTRAFLNFPLKMDNNMLVTMAFEGADAPLEWTTK